MIGIERPWATSEGRDVMSLPWRLAVGKPWALTKWLLELRHIRYRLAVGGNRV